MPASRIPVIAVMLLLGSVAACSDGGATVRGARGSVMDSSAGTVALGLGEAAYRSADVASPATIAGTISVQTPPADSIVAVARDATVCGDSASVTEVKANGNALSNALVWVEDIPAGKPLPELRRATLSIEGCRFDPRVIAVPARSTINVFSRDRAHHEPIFYREGAGEPIEHVQTFDAGSVVPSEKIAKAPGIVEARNKRQPWSRAYIAVFNHPYFAVTNDNGGFRIDSLPPGTYTVKVWHERMAAPAEQRVTVGASGNGRVDLALALR
jgi:hypothetical protein